MTDSRYSGAVFGPAVPVVDTPESRERHAAWQAAYDAAIARGLSDEKARIEGAKAHGDCARRQAGRPEPEPGHVGPRIKLPLTHLPPRPACPCSWCQTEGAHATSCTVHDADRDDGACDCGLVATGVAPGPMKADARRPAGPPTKGRRRP